MKKPLPYPVLKDVPLVYFVRCTVPSADGLHPVKIGETQGLIGRLSSLRGDNAHPLELLGVVVFSNVQRSRVFERRLHGKFHVLHLHNEWFSGAKGLLSYVRRVSTPVILPDDPLRDHTRTVVLPARIAALGGPAEPLMSVKQVADLLKTSTRMVSDLTRTGFLPVVQLSTTLRRYERSAVAAAVADWNATKLNKALRLCQLKNGIYDPFRGSSVLTKQQIDVLLRELREDAADAETLAKVKPDKP